MHGQYIRNIDRQLISEEDTFVWLSKGDLKQKLKVKQWQHKTKRYKRNITQQKYGAQKQRANANFFNNLMRQ